MVAAGSQKDGITVIFVSLESKASSGCVSSLCCPWNRPGQLHPQTVQQLLALDFSLRCLPLVLQEKALRGFVLDCVSQGPAFVSHGPSLLALV